MAEILVRGESQVRCLPDRALIHVGVEAEAASQQEAFRRASESASNVDRVLDRFSEALDRRVRSEDEIEEVLGLPLLGRLPAPPRHLRDGNGLVMLSQPGNVQAEAFRKLKTSLEFLNLEHGARTAAVAPGGKGRRRWQETSAKGAFEGLAASQYVSDAEARIRCEERVN